MNVDEIRIKEHCHNIEVGMKYAHCLIIIANKLDEYKKELLEQAKLNGQGAERELELLAKLEKYESALNKIAMLGSSELAYTKEYTEQVNQIAREALGVQSKWPY